MRNECDVIVVGGGHAGVEAATAAARAGAAVLLVTATPPTIGQMSCNPAIGGVAKGTVVREVDALGGIMGRAADRATIQFRMLNRSKGPAVWAPRAQCDRARYREAVQAELREVSGVRVVAGTVHALRLEGERVVGVVTGDGRSLSARAVVLTAGTFLRGQIHVGTDVRIPAGRRGERPSVELAEQLEAVGLEVLRFKTGTPPRIDGMSVDFGRVERQDSEFPDYRFSVFARHRRAGALPCWITWAGEPALDLVRDHLAESAMYGGAIAGRGPRYCPSIEDKVLKFPEAARHQVVLEPEGLDSDEMYVNGLSTSLPAPVQERMLRSIPGMERVRMTQSGYAIEYDCYAPDQLTPWLETRALAGLFFAGQINGTTGYEEAAGQGVVAGLNAARHVRNEEPIVFGRDQAYVGVMVDDLVTRGVDEPYRLFTSRAEYRLLLRQDNAIQRFTQIASELNLWTDAEQALVERRLREADEIAIAARETSASPTVVNGLLTDLGESPLDHAVPARELARRPRVGLRELLEHLGRAPTAEDESWIAADIELKYEGYLARERAAVRRLREMGDFELSEGLPYRDFLSVSSEAREKLTRVRPRSLAQAGRIPGVSPSDLQSLVHEVLKRRVA